MATMRIDGTRAPAPETAAQKKARQDAAWAARYTGGPAKSPVVTYTPPPAAAPSSGRTYGASTAASSANSAQASAARAAQSAANAGARSGANSQKSQLQQAIDAALAQKRTNQSKLDSLSSLVSTGLSKGRDTALAGIDRDLKTLLDQAFKNYDLQIGDLNTTLRDNEKSEADTSFGNLANRARERQDLVTAALAQGAGESDVLKAQMQALRNWSANQQESNRSYFDTLTSTNAAITDLNTGTKSNITGYEMDANARRGGIWSDYFTGMADAYTQMDNLATNQYLLDQEIAANQQNVAGQDALLSWLSSGKSAATFVAPATTQGSTAPGGPFTGYSGEAAKWAGQAWENPGVSQATQQWQGQQTQTGQLTSSQLQAAPTNTDDQGRGPKKPEGATLRKW